MRHFARVFAFAVVKPEWLNQHVHTRVRVDIPNNVVRDIEYGQNSMSEIKTLAHKMDIGRYGKLGTLGPKIFVACGGQKVGFHYRGVFRYTYSERHPQPPTVHAFRTFRNTVPSRAVRNVRRVWVT